MNVFIIIVILLAVILFAWSGHKRRQARREQYIDDFQFPASISKKIRNTYPHLTENQIENVLQGLQEYFQICRLAGTRAVSMPSQVVDVAWHEFILFTRQYDEFCKQAFGRFLHHTPAEAMKSKTRAQDGIKRAWRLACLREGQNPKAAVALPLLFALDTELNIDDGFSYALNCRGKNADYCASHIGCSSSGCSSGCSSDSSSSCGSGCGGGD